MTAITTMASSDKLVRALLEAVQGSAASRRAVNRRGFIALSGGLGAGLVLGFRLGATPASAAMAGTGAFVFAPNAYLRIAPDDTIVICAPVPEVGQGVKTALPMIVAEELDADWETITVEQAATDMSVYGRQIAGGSRAVPTEFDTLRRAGAVARAMLIAAAAEQWAVPGQECSTKAGVIRHDKTGRTLTYGALATAASARPVPDPKTVALKPRKDWRLIGQRIAGVDNRKIVTGAPLFGIDQKLPGMVYAVCERCPAVGGRVESANLDAIKAMPGIQDAFVLDGNGKPSELRGGIVILADSTWQAFQAKRALKVTWDETTASKDSTSALTADAHSRVKADGSETVLDTGDPAAAFSAGGRTVEAVYDFAMVAHATLEPQNCTATYRDGKLEIWAPTQTPNWGLTTVAELCGLAKENVTLHQIRGGGGFGRRLINDPVCEAGVIAMRVGKPVKLTWTREDDMAHDFYRVGGVQRFKAALDDKGRVTAWDSHQVTFSADGKSPVSGGYDPRGGGRTSVPEFPGAFVPNVHLTRTLLPLATPCGPWRAPHSNTFAFIEQSFLHECAIAAGRDHLAFLLDFYGAPRWLEDGNEFAMHTGRAAAVIKLAAAKAGWGKSLPKGRGLGLAFYFSHAGHIAEVAEVGVDAARKLTVHKVTVAADIGPVINRSGAENQAQGAVIDGLSAMLGQAISVEAGRVVEQNFDGYPLLRAPHAPDVAVHFIESEFSPTGMGEPALPPLAPAVANAIFAASSIRVRQLPIARENFSV